MTGLHESRKKQAFYAFNFNKLRPFSSLTPGVLVE